MTGSAKHSAAYYVRSVLRQTWDHPSNRDRRVRALFAAIVWQLRKRVGGRPRIVPYFGWRLWCYPDSNSASNVIYFTERYDPDEMGFMIAYLRPGDGYIDVGANIGTYSLLAASIVGPTGFVEAFEPHAVAVRRFEENAVTNFIDNIAIHQVAVTDSPGQVEFLQRFDVSNSIRTPTDAGETVESVTAVALDDVLPERSFSLGKLGVEGFETAALRGGASFLRAANPPVWQVEVLDHQLRKAGSSADELRRLLGDHGYLLGKYERESGAMHYLDEAEVPTNVWAVHRTAVDMVAERLAGGGAHLNGRGAS